ncbi:ATP-dependent RNA helicase HrpA [Luedemannella helvata]|uniref:ATP-dependent RNA helicase HrpA n=1 Tax=Luedemannella helvata TaxID=349315 RepID=A0ABP4XCB4_9ACTN
MATPDAGPHPAAELRSRLTDLTLRDEGRLRRRLDGARKIRNPDAATKAYAEIQAEIELAELRLAEKKARIPTIAYPEELPVSQRRDDLLAAIREHQVVIVAGETGSGKTTQLPKLCLEAGRGVRGMIGHTQPRRLAARTVADRIAEELGTTLGELVGYKVRFTDQVSGDTMVKLMTDGILLAELAHDRLLRQYDTLIIDEAHERSLNIDFILGVLKQILPKRPDLKLIITSATIDPERFSRHFGDAPIIEVSGRTYPVEVRYRPLVETTGEDEDVLRDQTEAILDAVRELEREGPGDILVFLSGEREIRDTADALNRADLRFTEVLPLYARLSTAEQHRVFQPHTGRRIVLATNVAETSLTVPGIKYVIDPGTARISRYSHRLKVQRLPIEAISQASANQRKGRCGRTSDGICIRLYDEQDFANRPEFTDPEILRTNLASVILQMTALELGEIADFPFLDPPEKRNIADGVALLHELGALEDKRLTKIGRQLAQLPIDPRLARMVLEADRNGCLDEVIVIAAALSIQDPRERPVDKQAQATQSHARFADPDSDFMALLNLWRYLVDKRRELSSNQFRRLCKNEYLNYLRVREWQDLVSQVRQVAKTLKFALNREPAEAAKVHTALLAGLLSHLGLYDPDKRDYLGARGGRFSIFPGSVLFKKNPRWLMSAELVETSKLWARVNARIDPEWVEPLAKHLVKRSYSEPHWEMKQGAVIAYEKVTLYGLPIVARRAVNYGRIDPALSRELFIRHALVEGDWRTHHTFFDANRALLDEVEELENRTRRRDILVDDETLFAFYDQRLPDDIVSGRHFDSWWRKARRDDPDLLNFEKSMLVNEVAGRIDAADYPDRWGAFPLTYQFEPGTAADGVTVHIPLPALQGLSADGFDWQIPGLREELVTALLRGLPKPVRVNFVPVPDTARAVLERLGEPQGALLPALERELRRMTGVVIDPGDWQLDKLPDHLRMTFRIEDDKGKPVAEGKDLDALRAQLRPKVRATIAAAADDLERTGLKAWPGGALPRSVERSRGGFRVTGWPALVDQQGSVAVRVFASEEEQRYAMTRGTRRLLLLTIPSPVPYLGKQLSAGVKLALMRNPHGGVPALLDDCIGASVDKLVADAGGPAWDEAGFARLRDAVRADLVDVTLGVVGAVEKVLTAAHEVRTRLEAPTFAPAVYAGAKADIRDQLDKLVYAGFVTETAWAHLADLPRYLRAILQRLEKLPANPARDDQLADDVARVQEEYDALLAEVSAARAAEPDIVAIRWMIEELRVSYFAQTLGTAYPISEKRIFKALDQIS